MLGVVENMSTLHIALDSLRFVTSSLAEAAASAATPLSNGTSTSSTTTAQHDLTAAVHRALQAALVDSGLVTSLADVAAAADVFLPTGGGAARMCEQLGLQLLGKVPLDPLLGQAAEEGRSVLTPELGVGVQVNGALGKGKVPVQVPPSAAALQDIVRKVLQQLEASGGSSTA